jgi:chromosomal replication initiation ATPase DnaA
MSLEMEHGGLPAAVAANTDAYIVGKLQALTAELRIEIVQFMTAMNFGISMREIQGATRGNARIALARQTAMYLCHTALSMRISDIARGFGRDPSTVWHALALVEDLRDDPVFDFAVSRLESTINRMKEPQ